MPRGALRGEPAARGAQVRRDGAARRRARAGLLQRLRARDRRRRARRGAAARARRARRRARHAHRLRGARLGPPRARLRPRLADRRGRPTIPNLGTCLDSFHILSRGADPAGIRDIPGEKIFFLQLADAPQLVMDVLQWSRHYRCFPGQGGFDLAGFLGHVLAAGYDGPLSLEVFNDVFRQADPRRMAVDAMRSLLLLEEAARAAATLPPAPLCAATRSSSSASRRGRGERRAAADRDGLPARRPAPHQGRCSCGGTARPASSSTTSTRPLPARASPRSPWRARTRSALRARAERLLAPVLPRDRGPDEADLSAIAAPDGTSVFFCRTDAADADSWVADFLTAGPPGAGRRHGADRHRPRRAVAAVRLLRRGGAVLPLGARPRARATAPSSRRPTGSSAAARPATPTAACASRSACRVVGSGGVRAPARRVRLRRHLRHARARCATAACRCSRSPATTTTTSPPGPSSSPRRSSGCASSASSTRRASAASSCTSTPPWPARAVLRGARAPRRLRRLWRSELAGADGRAAQQ